MENYRLGNRLGDGDAAVPFNAEKVARYEATAPDCNFWRQCISGLGNLCTDDAGRTAKNWWPNLPY